MTSNWKYFGFLQVGAEPPVACPNTSRISYGVAMPYFLGLTKMAAVTAYKDAFISIDLEVMGCSTPFSVARWMIL
jgi:hypothetical protein